MQLNELRSSIFFALQPWFVKGLTSLLVRLTGIQIARLAA